MGCSPIARSLLPRKHCRRTTDALCLAFESQHQPRWAMRLQQPTHPQPACPFSAVLNSSQDVLRWSYCRLGGTIRPRLFAFADLRKFTGESTYQPSSSTDTNIEGVSTVACAGLANERNKLSCIPSAISSPLRLNLHALLLARSLPQTLCTKASSPNPEHVDLKRSSVDVCRECSDTHCSSCTTR
jgi:hypothetical protein